MKNQEGGIKYEAPNIEIIEVEIEKGFASSPNTEDPDLLEEMGW